MVKSNNSKDNLKLRIASHEINKFNNLIKGHKKLLAAIGKL